MVDTDREGGTVWVRTVRHHRREVETNRHFFGDGATDEPFPFRDQKVHRFRRHLVTEYDKVPFILTVLVIHDDDGTPSSQFLNRSFN